MDAWRMPMVRTRRPRLSVVLAPATLATIERIASVTGEPIAGVAERIIEAGMRAEVEKVAAYARLEEVLADALARMGDDGTGRGGEAPRGG